MNPCESAIDRLGSIYYAGAYDPQFTDDGIRSSSPHENFTIYIPDYFETGPAVLSIPHAVLVGVSIDNCTIIDNHEY